MFQVTTEEMCLVIPLVMEFRVARVQEASISLYDYYEPRKRSSTSFFLIAILAFLAINLHKSCSKPHAEPTGSEEM